MIQFLRYVQITFLKKNKISVLLMCLVLDYRQSKYQAFGFSWVRKRTRDVHTNHCIRRRRVHIMAYKVKVSELISAVTTVLRERSDR